MKILFRTPNWLGDAVASRILLYNLVKEHDITLLTKDYLCEIFYDFECIGFKNKKEIFLKSLSLKKRKFDVGLILPLSFSSAFSMFLAHPKVRIGFSFEGRNIFLTKSLKIPKDWKTKHTIHTQLLLLKALNIEPVIPEVYFLPKCHNVKIPLKPFSYIVITPFTAFGNAKEWLFENYIHLSKIIFDQYGLKTIILGSKQDVPRLKNTHLPDSIYNLMGQTSLMEAACIIRHSKIFIGNDSGLSHLSASMGHLTLSIFGPTSPVWTKPIGKSSHVIWKPPDCAPCYKRTCPFGTKECMKNVSVELVVNAIEKILEDI